MKKKNQNDGDSYPIQWQTKLWGTIFHLFQVIDVWIEFLKECFASVGTVVKSISHGTIVGEILENKKRLIISNEVKALYKWNADEKRKENRKKNKKQNPLPLICLGLSNQAIKLCKPALATTWLKSICPQIP